MTRISARSDAARYMRPDAARYIGPHVARFLRPGTDPADVFPALDRKYSITSCKSYQLPKLFVLMPVSDEQHR
jgi:hypothetical protein